VQLGLENKKQMTWAIVLGVVALVVCAYELIPMFSGSSTQDSNAQAASPVVPRPAASKPGTKGSAKPGKQPVGENLDPTLRLDL
jgi:flagellar basal body-associated protein FliL